MNFIYLKINQVIFCNIPGILLLVISGKYTIEDNWYVSGRYLLNQNTKTL
jgi:hypothetical protein